MDSFPVQLTIHFKDRHVVRNDRRSYLIRRDVTPGIQHGATNEIIFPPRFLMETQGCSGTFIVHENISGEKYFRAADEGILRFRQNMPEQCLK